MGLCILPSPKRENTFCILRQTKRQTLSDLTEKKNKQTNRLVLANSFGAGLGAGKKKGKQI